MDSRFFIGFIIGWITYIGFWISKDFQGGLEIFTQPIMAALISSIFVFISFLVGLPIQRTVLKTTWDRIGYLSIFLTVIGVVCLTIPERLGLTHEAVHPETEQIFQSMNAIALAASYFCIIFPFVNWPKPEKSKKTEQKDSADAKNARG